MITFETQEEFESAVLQVIIDKLYVKVVARGYPFMTGVDVGIGHVDDRFSGGVLISSSDSVN